MRHTARLFGMTVLSLAIAACGVTGSGDRSSQDFARGSNANTDCSGQCATAATFLTPTDVRQVLAQAVAQARALGTDATIAVVDRVGNVLAVLRMPNVPTDGSVSVTIKGAATAISGLDGLKLPVAANAPCSNTSLDCAALGLAPGAPLTLPGDALAAIAKAITGAYLSSEGSGLSSRTASQIVQRHFNPGEQDTPSGPLFGVQFSQLPCSDFCQRESAPGRTGPQRSPLGLSADPGGFPLYKDGTPVGGIGVISGNFVYGLDTDVMDVDHDPDEIIALAGTFGYAVPYDRQASLVTIDLKTLRFSDVDFGAVADAARHPPPLQLGAGGDGELVKVRGYYDPSGGILPGTAFGQPASGIRPSVTFSNRDAFVFVDGSDHNRFPPTASADPNGDGKFLDQNEVRTLLDAALSVADQTRSQIRRPHGSTARVTISVVDAAGNILGMVRTRDAPVFGSDVSLQKARTATLFSSPDAATFVQSLPDAQYLKPNLAPANTIHFPDYVLNLRVFLGDSTALNNGVAFSDRAGGNLSRPNYPDGIDGNPNGPLSKPPGQFSIFSTGFQLDASFNAIISHLLYVFGKSANDVGPVCVGVPFGGTASAVAPRLANGSQIFPGSVPIYKGRTLVGGIGVSGDGVNQDDMIAFLGVYRAGQRLGTVNEAPQDMRADLIVPAGQKARLRYVNCPESPFVNSDAEDVCHGK